MIDDRSLNRSFPGPRAEATTSVLVTWGESVFDDVVLGFEDDVDVCAWGEENIYVTALPIRVRAGTKNYRP